MVVFRVSKDITKDCCHSISEAVRMASACAGKGNTAEPDEITAERVEILVEPGIYEEVVEIRRPNVSVIGLEGPEKTIIQYGNYANMLMEDGSKRGTFRSYVLLLDGDGNALEGLTIRNTAWPRSKVAQAIALYADGDGILVKNCHLESYQDTLFTGPLPPTAMIPGGFTGPKEFDERRMGRQIYEDCVIKGDVDFIFGSAMALFRNCDLVSRNGNAQAEQAPESGILGYVTAASTPEGYSVGYVFDHCRFLSEGCPKGSVYLGRPWRDHAKTVLLDCELGAHIHPSGFHDWNKTKARETVCYGEYQSFGEGADPSGRAPFVTQLTESQAMTIRNAFQDISNRLSEKET
ncbi:MAG: pectin methylesterase [Lachnospiraceae bacterium]|nr:pectin methylesterase [Lachnospiraceae bacterium]